MTWQDVLGVITDKAPAAGALLAPVTGGISVLAGLAIKTIANAFGIKSPDPKPEEVMAAIQADPQAALKLEQARLAFETEKMKLEYEEKDRLRNDEIETLKLQLTDVQSARGREIEIVKAAGSDWDKRFLTILGAVAPLAILTYIIIDGFPTLTSDITLLVGNLIGLLFAKYSTIFDYHMGTSSKK